MNLIKEQSLDLFLHELASKQATPGGGSAAAVMGAQGAALVCMVCNLTIGKPKYAEVAIELQDLLVKAETLRLNLIEMIKADVEAFEQLMGCYGLPKTSEQEKLYRAEQIQRALEAATVVPMQCARACAEVIALSRVAAEKGSLAVISDAGVAVMAAYAGLKSAALNVHINVGSLKNQDFAAGQLAELETIMAGIEAEVQAIYGIVKNKL